LGPGLSFLEGRRESRARGSGPAPTGLGVRLFLAEFALPYGSRINFTLPALIIAIIIGLPTDKARTRTSSQMADRLHWAREATPGCGDG
jgi:hypothetical protein